MPINSRIHARLNLDAMGKADLRHFLVHALEQAGAPTLMSDGLIAALAEHANSNLRSLCHVAALLVWAAAERGLPTIDESLFLDLTSTTHPSRTRGTA